MTYKPSPRPTFDQPTHIPEDSVTHHLWGDSESGRVPDWCYVSSNKIHQLILGLAPGSAFRHSADYKTKFAADEVYHVLSGRLALANPETGEVQVAEPGESILFRRDTWHHGFNIGRDALRVLEFIAPPPSTGSCGEYAITQPDLDTRRYTQDVLLGNLGLERSCPDATMRVVRDSDLVWGLEGSRQQLLVGLIASTKHLTVAHGRILPGAESDSQTHRGDLALYQKSGTLHIRVPENDGDRSFLLKPGDGLYLPEDTPFFYYNTGDTPADFLFAVAPAYGSGYPA
jgi:mannose-6-phosphate isomerase-like protein (cupin superfamily)